jgi:dinuclear metal center YbgI/SA1388 family protein
MKPTIHELLQTLENIAPTTLAEKWDNVGLLVGSTDNSVASILIGLDPTTSLIDEAIHLSADTVITHHPVIFKPLTAINTADPAGRLLQKALQHNISIIGCHTNLDSAVDGVNDVLAEGLGLSELTPLLPAEAERQAEGSGLGRIGTYSEPLSSDAFLARLYALLGLQSLTIAGSLPRQIATVALCGGSGSDLAPLAYSRGADVYVSAEIKHATAVWAKETGFAIIDGTHYATEKPATLALAKTLRRVAAANNWQTRIHLTETEQAPLVSHHISHLQDKP